MEKIVIMVIFALISMTTQFSMRGKRTMQIDDVMEEKRLVVQCRQLTMPTNLAPHCVLLFYSQINSIASYRNSTYTTVYYQTGFNFECEGHYRHDEKQCRMIASKTKDRWTRVKAMDQCPAGSTCDTAFVGCNKTVSLVPMEFDGPCKITVSRLVPVIVQLFAIDPDVCYEISTSAGFSTNGILSASTLEKIRIEKITNEFAIHVRCGKVDSSFKLYLLNYDICVANVILWHVPKFVAEHICMYSLIYKVAFISLMVFLVCKIIDKLGLYIIFIPLYALIAIPVNIVTKLLYAKFKCTICNKLCFFKCCHIHNLNCTCGSKFTTSAELRVHTIECKLDDLSRYVPVVMFITRKKMLNILLRIFLTFILIDLVSIYYISYTNAQVMVYKPNWFKDRHNMPFQNPKTACTSEQWARKECTNEYSEMCYKSGISDQVLVGYAPDVLDTYCGVSLMNRRCSECGNILHEMKIYSDYCTLIGKDQSECTNSNVAQEKLHKEYVEAMQKMIQVNTEGLKLLGFTPVRLHEVDFNAQPTSINLNINSEHDGQVSGSLEFSMDIVTGSSAFYRINYKDIDSKNTFMLDARFKIENAYYLLEYKHSYRTCKTKSFNTITKEYCTDQDCEKDAEFTKMNGTLQKWIRTSNWGCEKAWCFAVNSGSLCLKCSNVYDTSDCYDIYDQVSIRPMIKFCALFGLQGYCKEIDVLQSISSKKLSIALATQSMDLFETKYKRIATHISFSKNDIYTGEILGEHEVAEKFGAPQLTMNNKVKAFTASIKARADCEFEKSRTVVVSSCFLDTFYLKDTLTTALKANNYEMTKQTSADFAMRILNQKLGLAVIKLEVSDFSVVHYPADKTVEIGLSDCAGCFDCIEGFICQLLLRSPVAGVVLLTCNYPTLIKYVNLKPGELKVTLSFSAMQPHVEITCWLEANGRRMTQSNPLIVTLAENKNVYHLTNNEVEVRVTDDAECDLKCMYNKFKNAFDIFKLDFVIVLKYALFIALGLAGTFALFKLLEFLWFLIKVSRLSYRAMV